MYRTVGIENLVGNYYIWNCSWGASKRLPTLTILSEQKISPYKKIFGKTSTHDRDYQYPGSIQWLGKSSWSWFLWYFAALKISDWDASYVHNVADFKLSITIMPALLELSQVVVDGDFKVAYLGSTRTKENSMILILYSW